MSDSNSLNSSDGQIQLSDSNSLSSSETQEPPELSLKIKIRSAERYSNRSTERYSIPEKNDSPDFDKSGSIENKHDKIYFSLKLEKI